MALISQEHEKPQVHQDPLAIFSYALKATETKRQYPRRFKVFLDFLELGGSFKDQAYEFVIHTKQDHRWAQDNLMRFIDFQNERCKSKEISESTVSNYYKATKVK